MKAIHIIISLLLSTFSALSQNAADILERAASAYRNSNGISASFSMRAISPTGTTTDSSEGTIDMKGDKFTLVASDIKTWYDGKTQWVYVEPANEVNISSPAGEDLQLTNPAILLRDYRMGYVSRYTGEATGANGKSIQNVELQPKNKSDITKITLQIEKTSSLPIHIQLEMKNGNRSVIQISNIRTGVNRPDDYFTFRQSNYPGVETIDLR